MTHKDGRENYEKDSRLPRGNIRAPQSFSLVRPLHQAEHAAFDWRMRDIAFLADVA
jgi:hypothetical protein